MIGFIFEHCSVKWSPQTATHLEQFVTIKKGSIKWINGEPYSSYNDDKLATEQKKLNIIPVKQKFIYNDLYNDLKKDIQKDAGPLQTCAGHEGG